ncbi:hypothetical protein LVY75_23350 [Sinorhizobium sp. B11]|jgi:hypothetical protein
MRATIAITLIAGLLAGCAPTQQEYQATVTALQGSPRLRTEALNNCVQRLSRLDKSTLHDGAVLMNVSDKDAPRVGCARMQKALVSGRATYQDAVDITNNRMTPRVIKIFQDR